MPSAIRRPLTAFSAQPPKAREAAKDRVYLAWLRQQRCIVLGRHIDDVVTHHVRLARGADGGLVGIGQLGVRVPDRQCVPVSHRLHADVFPGSIHAGNEAEFWQRAGLDPLVAAQEFHLAYQAGHRGVLTAEEFEVIRMRSKT